MFPPRAPFFFHPACSYLDAQLDLSFVREWVRSYHATEDYAKAMRKRSLWVEPLFGVAPQWHGR